MALRVGSGLVIRIGKRCSTMLRRCQPAFQMPRIGSQIGGLKYRGPERKYRLVKRPIGYFGERDVESAGTGYKA